ncbi:MAG: hypothetical protein V3V01_20765 [Acidimicrobiales bacterium]
MNLLAVVALGAIVAGCASEKTVRVADQELKLVTIDPADDDTELVEYTSSVLGGVRFSVDPAHHLYTRGDTIAISITDPAGEAAWEVASISLVTQTADGIPIESVEQVVELLAAAPSAVVTSTGTAIEVLGHHLAGYEVRADASTRDHLIIAADRAGSPAATLFGFTPNARIFLAETPAGVLIAGSGEADEVSNIEAIDVALGTLLATIEATGGGVEESLPQAQTLAPNEVQESKARGELDPAGPTALDAPFSPVEPGTYQLANFGPTFTLDFDDGWFTQPNFPGFIVLTAANGGGPNDRDLVLLTGLVDVMPIAPGPVAAGEPISVVTADQVIEALGADIEITGRAEVDLDGVTATRFDIRIPSDALCTQADPCELAFRTSSGIVKRLSPTHSHRIWWIEEGAEGPSMIIAVAPHDHDFLNRATELLDTIEFTS